MTETDFTNRILSSYTSSDFKKSLVHSLDLLESDTENSFAKQCEFYEVLKFN